MEFVKDYSQPNEAQTSELIERRRVCGILRKCALYRRPGAKSGWSAELPAHRRGPGSGAGVAQELGGQQDLGPTPDLLGSLI